MSRKDRRRAQARRNSRSQRVRVPSEVDGINFIVARPQPSIAFSATVEGEDITLDQFQVASAATLVALRAKSGVMRLSSSGWRLAVDDVAHALHWGMAMECDGEADRLLFYLDDTRPPGRIQVVDVTLGANGQLVASEPTDLAPRLWG